jgi:uncharacterized protein YjbI with pentapeptide repeats
MCQFEKGNWKCPLDAEEGHDFCYWHREIEGKEPSNEQLNELKNTEIYFVFLQKAKLLQADLEKANLSFANLTQAHLQRANLQEARLYKAKLQEANLERANLQEANLKWTNLQKANLTQATLQKTDLLGADLQKASLFKAKLQKAVLSKTKMQEANLERAKMQDTNLENANLWKANLKNANMRKAKLYLAKLQNTHLSGTKLQGADLSETLSDSNTYLIDANLKDANLYKSFLDSTKTLRYSIIFEDESLNEKEINEQRADEEAYREKKHALYQASLEVYNKLYHFYSDEGMDFRAKHAHYRRSEVKRKLLLVKHEKLYTRDALPDTFRSAFDRFFLKMLTGYGQNLMRPILISVFSIFAFGFIFWLLNGVAVDPEARGIQLLDYFYLSLTTFTGLGFSNVQPDITVPLMQPLIMLESVFGVTMVALIIFVITYQISSR